MDTKSKKSDSLQEKETKNNETLKWDGVVAAKKKNGSPGAFALAFVLCVLLGVGGVVAGFVGLSFVDAKLRSAKGAAEYVSGAAPEDLLSDRPYIESEFFKSMAGRNLEAVFLLHYHYREGVDKLAQEAATKAYENCLREIYGLLNDRGVNYFYFSPHEYIPFAETMMEAAVEIGPVYIAFDTRKIQGDGRIFESYSSGAEDNDVVGEEMKPWGVDGVKEALEEVYADELKQLKEALLHSCQTLYREDFEMSIDRLNASGALYYAGDGDAHIANVKLGADGLPADPSVFDKTAARVFAKPDGDGSVDVESVPAGLGEQVRGRSLPDGTRLYVAWPDEALEDGASALTAARLAARRVLIPAAVAIIAALVLLILLIVRTGRRREDGSRRMYAWDRVFVEIQLFLMLLVSIPVIYTVQAGEAPTFTDIPSVLIASALLASICAIELGCLLSIVRIIESRLLHRRLLTWIVLKWIGRGVRGLARVLKSGFDGRNPLAKTIILVVLFWFVMAISAAVFYDGEFGIAGFMMLAALALALYFSVRWAARYGELKRGVEKIADGDLAYKIPVPDGAASEFDKLSLKVNEIGSATELAMQSEIRNQRLKTDLISNVSHDLKTPLTSIITYTDLLKKEGADSANAAEYIGIIEEKSHRLKKLTEDLFEAAKASSGAMPVRREKVDLLSLINQDLVELGDGLAGIGLNVIVGAEKEHYYVNADSQLLWRVVDNLLNNVRKYAMPGSRVYIELKDYSGGAPLAGRGTTSLEIKNISAAGLNIPAEELMERFKRGDDSRATEGSGLGLSIAKDLVRLMDGRFDISIDGDLFKATMTLASWVGG